MTKTNLPKNTAAALAYLFGWISGIAFLLLEDDPFVRFHAMQSLLVFGLLTIIRLVPIIGWILSPILMLVTLFLGLFLIIKAYQGEKFALPVIGQWAQKLLENSGASKKKEAK